MTPHRHVVCAIDSQMTYALAVLLGSLVRSASGVFHITVGYLEDTLPESDRQLIRSVADELSLELEFMPLPSNPLFIAQGHISPTTFTKFLLADAIPDAHLWLDADTIALAGWDSVFTMIDDTTADQGLLVARRSGGRQTEKGMAFNAGVLGWPAAKRRDWETPLKNLDVVDTQEQFLFNSLYSESAEKMSEKFNVLTYHLDRYERENSPFIIHFAGAHKPWHLRRDLSHHCRNYPCPWSVWFDAEDHLFSEIQEPSTRNRLHRLETSALTNAPLRRGRDQAGLRLLRFLNALGPFAPGAIRVLSLLKQWVPRGTHPLH